MKDLIRFFITVISPTQEKYKGTPDTNIFLTALDKEDAIKKASEAYKGALKMNGFSNVEFAVVATPSSMEEAKIYFQTKQLGYRTYNSVN